MKTLTHASSLTLTRKPSLLRALLHTARPRQWVKNGIVLAGLVFSGNLFERPAADRALAAAIVFSLMSSAVYFMNDLFDLEKDRRHPVKRLRPIASGQVAPALGVAAAVGLFGVSGLGAWALGRPFGLTVLGYAALQFTYSMALKQLVIIDVLAIAAGFVLRAVAGALVIGVPISPWLLVCTVLLALFLGLTKRRHELNLLQAGATEHRPILEQYTPAMLDQMISIVTAGAVMAYSLYTFTDGHSQAMMWTIPFVLYGVFRYLFLVHRHGDGGSPEQTLLRDGPLLLDVVLWIGTAVVILYVVR
ncbi:MAG: decaprenyl-phosphate phosphoribosyltransferase [Symbiobacteriia bacterium]